MHSGDTIKLETFSKKRLDDLLAQGYFRSGKNMFFCPVTFLDGEANTTIRTRLNLKDHKFSKSVRKLFRQNNQKFSSEFVDYSPDPEVIDLYDLYKEECFKGDLSGDLEDWLVGSENKEIYDSKICKIYDGDQLIGASFIDVGETSIASIMGIYHPDYKKYSIGIYSMLLEVEFAKKQGKDFYYAGYILSKSDRFEYKKKVGPLEFIRVNEHNWIPLEEMEDSDYLVEHTFDKLGELHDYLGNFMIESEMFSYPLFSWNSYPLDSDLLEQYFFLLIEIPSYETMFILITYDALEDVYQVCLANSLGPSSPTWIEFLNYYPEEGNWLDTVLIRQKGKKMTDIGTMPLMVLNILDKLNKVEQD